ncbi:MAG: universal stress protein [Noviherbaspirillum sp.]
MLKVLLAVDGSEYSLHAVAYVIKRTSLAKLDWDIHLINVQNPLHGSISTFIHAAQIKQYHHDEGMKALAPARDLLDKGGIVHQYHLFVGEPAEVIARYAKEQGCDEIVMGARGLSGIASILVGSVAATVINLAEIPVLLVK